MQKLTPTDVVEYYQATFERIAVQQKWPKEVWAMQIGILRCKAMEAYSVFTPEVAVVHDKIKETILRRYKETYCQ